MPTYAYACTGCCHRFDAQQSFTDDSLTQCPECAGRLRKVFSSVGVVFKGSGFYRNDSRTSGRGAPTASNTSDPSATSAGGGTTGSEAASAGGGSGSEAGTKSTESTTSGSGTSGSDSAKKPAAGSRSTSTHRSTTRDSRAVPAA